MADRIRYTKKDLRAPDEFMSAFARIVAWTRKNAVKIAFATAAVILAFGGVYGTKAYVQWKEAQASRDLWPHLNIARELLVSPSPADEEKLASLEEILSAHVAVHPDSRASVFARYYIGTIAYRRGDHDLSAEQFRAAIGKIRDGELMSFLLRQGLANALEAKGDFAGAAAAYRDAASVAGSGLQAEARTGEARMLEFLGRPEEAASLYRRILADNPDTPVRDFIRIKIHQLG
jgi:tetratricopeptide (TPR) repeat protein